MSQTSKLALLKKTFVLFIVMEFLAGWLAVLLFRSMDSRYWAAVLAGSGFVLVGLVILYVTRRWVHKGYVLTVWGAHIHLWLSAIPLLAIRLMVSGDISALEVFGLSVGSFHKFSEMIYMALVAATAADLVRVFFFKVSFGPYISKGRGEMDSGRPA